MPDPSPGPADAPSTAAAPDPAGEKPTALRPGIALCLSGGGYRAMVFHVGALWRVNEAGLLPKINRISSVSGGSITSAVLALQWKTLDFKADGVAARFGDFVKTIREFAGRDIDAGAVIAGLFLPGSINDRVIGAYDKHLFHGRTLQDLPDEAAGTPRFIFHATNIQSGALWRFEKKQMGDYRVGLVDAPRTRLAIAVAASSAFPPILSPAEVDIDQPMRKVDGNDLHYEPYTKTAVLSDGGVYDNLALETAFKTYQTVLVSDGGMKMSPDPKPKHDWARHSIRVMEVIDNQVRSLRKRFLVDSYQRGEHTGAYWGIATRYGEYELPDDPLGAAARDSSKLAAVPTRLEAMPADVQERLINWGYTVCDAALRKYCRESFAKLYGVTIAPPRGFPYPKAGY